MGATCSRSRLERATVLLCMGVGSFLLTGCTRIRLTLGTRTSLAKIPATTMDATLPEGPAIAPGESSGIVLSFTDANGKVWTTEGAGKGKVPWKDLTVAATLVTYKKGTLTMPHDPRLSDGKTGHVDITATSHPSLHAAFDVPPRYDYNYAAGYGGSNGSSGIDGINGTAGSSGMNGSTDPDNPSPGGRGGDGTNGTDGSNGGDGGNGPNLDVYVTLRAGVHPLLEAGVTTPGRREHFYLIDPQGGSLTVSSDGGSGGSGGHGGRGGAGGSGGSGSPPGFSGNNGLDGHDGSRGSDGSAGRVTVHYDASVQPFLSVIHAPRGSAVHQESVPLLW